MFNLRILGVESYIGSIYSRFYQAKEIFSYCSCADEKNHQLSCYPQVEILHFPNDDLPIANYYQHKRGTSVNDYTFMHKDATVGNSQSQSRQP